MCKRLTKKKILLALIGTSLFSSGANVYAAEAEPMELEEVVVTANRVEEDKFKTDANVHVITRKDIEKQHYQTVSDALRSVPGVIINNYSATGANYSSDYLYINGTSHVVVLLDGQRLNTNGSVSSVFQPSEVSDMDNIERIEVLKGSASTLYGSDAIGGVINIITKKAKKAGTSTKLSTAFGSYGKKMASIHNQGMTETGTYWSVGAQVDAMGNYKDAHGNHVINDIDSKTYDIKLGQKISDRADVNVTYKRYLLDYQRPKNSFPLALKSVVTEGKKDNQRLGINFDYKFNKEFSNKFSYFTRKSNLDDNKNFLAELWLMREKTWGFSDQLNYVHGVHNLVAGFDYYKDEMLKYTDQYTPNMVGDISNRAFFVQDQMTFGSWTFTPGIRFTDNSQFGHNTSISGTVAYDVNDDANVYVSYKEFFRAPYIYQILSPSFGSRDLKPEKGHTMELGGNVRVGEQTNISAHVFQTEADNQIDFDSTTWHYTNTGEEKTNGWDLQIQHKFSPEWNVRAAYTHMNIEAKPGQNPNRNGTIPKGTLDLGVGYTVGKFDADFVARGVFDRPGNKANEANVSDAYKNYWVANLAMNYHPEKDMTVFLKVNNLFNRMFTEATYDMRNPGGAGWYSQPGRNFLMGIDYKF